MDWILCPRVLTIISPMNSSCSFGIYAYRISCPGEDSLNPSSSTSHSCCLDCWLATVSSLAKSQSSSSSFVCWYPPLIAFSISPCNICGHTTRTCARTKSQYWALVFFVSVFRQPPLPGSCWAAIFLGVLRFNRCFDMPFHLYQMCKDKNARLIVTALSSPSQS